MTDNKKAAILSILAATGIAVLSILASLKGCVENEPVTPSPSPSISTTPAPSPTLSVSPAPSPTLSPAPSPTLSPTPIPTAQKTLIIQSFERPEYALSTDWKPAVTRTILTGQTTSFVLKSTDPCGLIGVPGIQKIQPVTLTKPSAPTYTAGVYYDALVPLTALNCAGTAYMQIDASSSIQVGDAQITIVKKTTVAPTIPSVPLAMDFNNWTMVLGYGGSTLSTGTDALPALQMLAEHRISPYKGQEVADLAGLQKYVLPFALGPVYMGSGAAPSFSVPVMPGSYAYIVDEPAIGNTAAISTALASWITKAPSVKPMMTSSLRQRDYRQTIGGVTNPNFAKLVDWPADIKAGIKIFTVVAEQFCQETWAGSGDIYPCKAEYDAAGKDFWLYVSNMSHGNEGSAASGAPDLVIDRSAVESFGFFLLAIKYQAKGLLYYNAIQGWDAYVYNATLKSWSGRDVWTDPYQYGGNGDGLRLYPDRAKRMAYPSIRLKLDREASQWADIVTLAGKQAAASALMTSTTKWDHALSKFEQIRTDALALLP